jgi:hypothetical protein
MTGQLTREVAHRAAEVGAPVQEKPFSLGALQTAIEEAKHSAGRA